MQLLKKALPSFVSPLVDYFIVNAGGLDVARELGIGAFRCENVVRRFDLLFARSNYYLGFGRDAGTVGLRGYISSETTILCIPGRALAPIKRTILCSGDPPIRVSELDSRAG